MIDVVNTKKNNPEGENTSGVKPDKVEVAI